MIELKTVESNKQKVSQKISSWLDSVYETPFSWKANNLHIDEIDNSLSERDQWVLAGLYCLSICKEIDDKLHKRELIPFLHIELCYVNEEKHTFLINYESVLSQLSEYTPPSLNCCDFSYYKEFYKKNLKRCSHDSQETSLDKFGVFYFRTYFDKTENSFSQELYVFPQEY